MHAATVTYFLSWFRWQNQDWYALWLTTPDKDALWANESGRVPLFATSNEVKILGQRLGILIEEVSGV